MKENRRMEV